MRTPGLLYHGVFCKRALEAERYGANLVARFEAVDFGPAVFHDAGNIRAHDAMAPTGFAPMQRRSFRPVAMIHRYRLNTDKQLPRLRAWYESLYDPAGTGLVFYHGPHRLRHETSSPSFRARWHPCTRIRRSSRPNARCALPHHGAQACLAPCSCW